MELRISERLKRVAWNVQSAGVVADIGCDHGFTSIYLVRQGLAQRVIAMDINKGPLERAREHIRQYQMDDVIVTRLSDGAKALQPGEADTLLVSGMGGGLICRILRDSPQVVGTVKELVLSPQSEPYLVRHLLHDLGFAIDREEMLVEQGKYYVILHAVPGEQHYFREEEYIYGERLIRSADSVLEKFVEGELVRLDNILDSLTGQSRHARDGRELLEQKRGQAAWTLGQIRQHKRMR